MIGRRIGCWTFIAADPNLSGRWVARCACGAERSFPEHRLRKPQGLSCKCQGGFSAARAKHGMSHEPIYAIWGGMKNRCSNPKHPAYENYGKRGIVVCDRWLKFENFLADMGATYRPGLTLEREDNDGDYGPFNCFWATMAQQNRNQRRNVYIETCRGRMTMQDAAKIAGITWRAMAYRVGAGWSGERLFIQNSAYTKSSAA